MSKDKSLILEVFEFARRDQKIQTIYKCCEINSLIKDLHVVLIIYTTNYIYVVICKVIRVYVTELLKQFSNINTD